LAGNRLRRSKMPGRIKSRSRERHGTTRTLSEKLRCGAGTYVARCAERPAIRECERHVARDMANHGAQRQAAFTMRGKHEVVRWPVQPRASFGLQMPRSPFTSAAFVQRCRNTASWLTALWSARQPTAAVRIEVLLLFTTWNAGARESRRREHGIRTALVTCSPSFIKSVAVGKRVPLKGLGHRSGLGD
jgi:hypothetical protein